MNKSNVRNAGFSLIELIVTITIASILVGTVSLGISLAFSKDASRCATILNDALYSVRMDSMSKSGNYTLIIKNIGSGTNTKFVAEITHVTDTTETETVYLEGDSNADKIDDIEVFLMTDGSVIQTNDLKTDEIRITFDKSKGCVDTVNLGGTDISGVGIIQFHIVSRRGSSSNRDAYVSLITSTGKHKVGTF